MLYTEVARYYEELGEDLSLSNIVSSNELLGYRALLKSAEEPIKEKYLPRLANGEVSAAWCLGRRISPLQTSHISIVTAEEKGGSDPSGVTTTASLQEDCFLISGRKVLVTNAQNSQVDNSY